MNRLTLDGASVTYEVNFNPYSGISHETVEIWKGKVHKVFHVEKCEYLTPYRQRMIAVACYNNFKKELQDESKQ